MCTRKHERVHARTQGYLVHQKVRRASAPGRVRPGLGYCGGAGTGDAALGRLGGVHDGQYPTTARGGCAIGACTLHCCCVGCAHFRQVGLHFTQGSVKYLMSRVTMCLIEIGNAKQASFNSSAWVEVLDSKT